MNTYAQRFALLPSSIGWVGGIGLAMLVAAAILSLTLLLPAREESMELSNETQQLERKLATARPSAQPLASLQQQMDEFLSSLPGQDQINAQLTSLHEIAARNHLVLRNGEYRTTSARGGSIGRLQITVRAQGSYTDVRRLLQQLPAALPALSVSRLTLGRQKPSETALETNIEFALFYKRAET